jgi:hypothetical protein
MSPAWGRRSFPLLAALAGRTPQRIPRRDGSHRSLVALCFIVVRRDGAPARQRALRLALCHALVTVAELGDGQSAEVARLISQALGVAGERARAPRWSTSSRPRRGWRRRSGALRAERDTGEGPGT